MANLHHADDSGRGKAALFVLQLNLYYGCLKNRPQRGRDREQSSFKKWPSLLPHLHPSLVGPAGSTDWHPESSRVSPPGAKAVLDAPPSSGQAVGRGWMGFQPRSPPRQPEISQVLSPSSASDWNEAMQGVAGFLRPRSCLVAEMGWEKLSCLLQHPPGCMPGIPATLLVYLQKTHRMFF